MNHRLSEIRSILIQNYEKELKARDFGYGDENPIWCRNDFDYTEVWNEMLRLKKVINEIEKIIPSHLYLCKCGGTPEVIKDLSENAYPNSYIVVCKCGEKINTCWDIDGSESSNILAMTAWNKYMWNLISNLSGIPKEESTIEPLTKR
jgi:hypothetical protein